MNPELQESSRPITRRHWLAAASGSLIGSTISPADGLPPTPSIPTIARRFSEHCENDPRTSADLVAAYRVATETDDADAPGYAGMSVVHYRGSLVEFELGRAYSDSTDPLDRVVGADVLAQLGWSDRCFLDESLAILLRLLQDSDVRVITAAANAFGHRHDPRAIPALLRLVSHPNDRVRFGVVHGLSQHDDERAIAGLITLSADEDDAVRDWATFGLASLCEVDTSELRDALVARLTDSDDATRGEALIGLASRRDPRVLQPLITELSGEFHGSWCLSAAEYCADRTLLALLESLRQRVPENDHITFASDFDRAIRACSQGKPLERL